MAQKPSIPKGTRDFSPDEVVKRNYIMDTIKSCFTTYGFQPIETPSFENSETLMGKYGEEGDRLIFKILNSGDYLGKVKEDIEITISVYTSISYSFSYLIKTILNLIPDKSDFLSFIDKELSKIIKSKKAELCKNIKIDSAAYLYGHGFNNEIVEKLVNSIEKNQDVFLRAGEAFILNNNLDIRQRRDNPRLLDYYLRTNDNPEFLNAVKLIANHVIEQSEFEEKFDSNSISKEISEKALRYDLTVPFARYVVQHQNEITFPFKRYQMQPVWRADRPQKGRFREFYQCDADVVGSDSLWQEVELVQLYDAVFTQLQLKGTTIKLNNRKVLSGIAEVIGEADKLIDFTVALDKLDKIGEEGVKKELREKGISEGAIEKVQPLFSVSGSASEKLNLLSTLLASSEVGRKGIEELSFIVNAVASLGLQSATLEIDVTLARGLNYYTGAIFEVSAPAGVAMGSIGGGGRYDDLTGIFGLKNMSGVGISFGLDRIYLVLEELNLFPETASAQTKVLFINFGEAEAMYAMNAITQLRLQGISAELYPDAAKMGKQMSYADKRNIPFAVLAGESEIASNTYTLKNMKTGEQDAMDLPSLVKKVQ